MLAREFKSLFIIILIDLEKQFLSHKLTEEIIHEIDLILKSFIFIYFSHRDKEWNSIKKHHKKLLCNNKPSLNYLIDGIIWDSPGLYCHRLGLGYNQSFGIEILCWSNHCIHSNPFGM